MHPYIESTEYAASNLLRLITEEEIQLHELTERLKQTEAKLNIRQWDFQSSDLSEDFSDAYVMAAFGRAAATAKRAEEQRIEAANLQACVGAHQQATQAMAGALLQIAKQGISLVHGELRRAPEGRAIGSLNLRDIIWQCRNQSMHYEEGSFKPALTSLFTKLEVEQGPHFSLQAHPCKSRAKQVVGLLGWVNYAAYQRDMQSLLQGAASVKPRTHGERR